MRKLAAGNWKMNGSMEALAELKTLAINHDAPSVDILICPPAIYLPSAAQKLAGTAVALGAQDCHPGVSGAHTGDLAAEMLAEMGASAIIVGHSERRADHGEDDATVRAKAEAAHRAGVIAIICIGETLDQREAGETLSVVQSQLEGSVPEGATAENTVIAYEPVWAIGTGKVATPDQVAEVHTALREALPSALKEARILYGGSVKASNAGEIFAQANVDGALVGGASLKAEDFSPIVTALEAA
ncbi:MAG: triose-phosphate isomerase [Shimia sp.]